MLEKSGKEAVWQPQRTSTSTPGRGTGTGDEHTLMQPAKLGRRAGASASEIAGHGIIKEREGGREG